MRIVNDNIWRKAATVDSTIIWADGQRKDDLLVSRFYFDWFRGFPVDYRQNGKKCRMTLANKETVGSPVFLVALLTKNSPYTEAYNKL